MKKLLAYLTLTWLWIKNLWIKCFGKNYIANMCKHRTKRQGLISVLEKHWNNYMCMPLAENGSPDYCLECIGNMSVRCVWCQEPIVIGDPVVVAIPCDQNLHIPEGSHSFKGTDGRLVVVGCLGWNCADTGADRNGFWMPPGKVERVPSPMEIALQTGGMVIVSDLGDQKNIGSVHIDGPAG